MTITLKKDSRTTYVAAVLGTDYDPGQAYVPERCFTIEETFTMLVSTQPTQEYEYKSIDSFGGSYRVPAGSTPVYGPSTNTESVVVGSAQPKTIVGYMVPTATLCGLKATKTVTRLITTCSPAIPYRAPVPGIAAIPAREDIDLNIGWNSGARSINPLVSAGSFSFKAPTTNVGVVAGLTTGDTDFGYTAIDFAWYLSRNSAKVYEKGAAVYNAGNFTNGDVFVVERRKGKVEYKINGVLKYTSQAAIPTISLYADTSLYSAGDYLYEPSFSPINEEYGGAEVTLKALNTLSYGGYSSYGESDASLGYLTTSAGVKNSVLSALLPPTSWSSDRAYGEATVKLLTPSADSGGGFLMPEYVAVSSFLPFIMGSSTGLTGGIGGGSVDLPKLQARSSEGVYGEVAVSLSPLNGLAETFDGPLDATIHVDLVALDLFWVDLLTYITISSDLSTVTVMTVQQSNGARDTANSAGIFGSTMVPSIGAQLLRFDTEVSADSTASASIRFDDTLLSLTSATSTLDVQGIFYAVMQSFIRAGFDIPLFDADNNIYVVNEAGQTSRYENYAFNSLGMFEGRYYGTKEDGVYLLEGSSDDLSHIRASINVGAQTFGTTELKRVSNCYIGVAADGQMYVKVTANGEEFIYRTRDTDTTMATQRVDIGKGIRASHMTFELFNEDGCDFELGSVEILATPVGRRI